MQYYIQDIVLWKFTTAFYVVKIADIGIKVGSGRVRGELNLVESF